MEAVTERRYVFSGSIWEKPLLDQVQPLIRSMVQEASEYISELGLESVQPTSVFIHKKMGGELRYLGWTTNCGGIVLAFQQTELPLSESPDFIKARTGIAVHELAHLSRQQYFDLKDETGAPGMLERAATEGIAVLAENAYLVTKGASEHSIVKTLRLKSSLQLQRMYEEFYTDTRAYDSHKFEGDYSLYDKWFVESTRGYLLGAYAVGLLLAKGTAISEVLKEPAVNIIGI